MNYDEDEWLPPTIKKITKAYTRLYTDNKSTKAYVEFVDSNGKTGRTEGSPSNAHMKALFARARREGVKVKREVW